MVPPHPLVSNQLPLRVRAIHAGVDIFSVFERMGVRVERPETQQMKCPFHRDHSPSARVYAEQNVLYCFTCQKRWDVIQCVCDHFHLSFTDAVAWLEQEFGLGGVSPSLTGSIRMTLSAAPTPPVAALTQTMEQRLKAQRQALGFERYSRALLALDLFAHDAPTLKRPELQRRLDALSRVR